MATPHTLDVLHKGRVRSRELTLALYEDVTQHIRTKPTEAVAIEVSDYLHGHVLCLQAGAGLLACIAARQNPMITRVTCIEADPDLVEAGRVLFSQAEWLNRDPLEADAYHSRVNAVLSWPELGTVSPTRRRFGIRSTTNVHHLICAAASYAEFGVFVIPIRHAPVLRRDSYTSTIDDRSVTQFREDSRIAMQSFDGGSAAADLADANRTIVRAHLSPFLDSLAKPAPDLFDAQAI